MRSWFALHPLIAPSPSRTAAQPACTDMGSCISRSDVPPNGAEKDTAAPVLVREEVKAAPAATTLPAGKLASVTELFAEWNFNGDGMIPLDFLDRASVNVGPHKSKVMSELRKMDFNGDGMVEEKEWLEYFTAVGLKLSDSEFEVVLTTLKQQGEDMVTIARLTAMAEEGPMPTGEEEAEFEPLPAARGEKVEALWAAWDYEGKGKIALDKVTSTELTVGNKTMKALSGLKDMDFNGDKVVDKEEMFKYFQIASPSMQDDAFDTIIGEMTEVATRASNVAKSVQLVEQMKAEADGAGFNEGEEVEEMAPLSEARAALVKELFAVFNADFKPIKLASLNDDCTVGVGATSMKMFDNISAMDANGDGMLELDEMMLYFTAVSQTLDDQSFEEVLKEMIGNANSAAIIKQFESDE